MKLKFILLLLTFFANVFLFSQNKTSNNKKAESVENTKREKENSFNSKIAKAKAKLGSTEKHGFSTKRSSEAENWDTLVPPSDMEERARKYEQKKQMETIGLVVLGGILLFFGYKIITSNNKDKKPEVPQDYNEKDYDEVKKKLNDMFSDVTY